LTADRVQAPFRRRVAPVTGRQQHGAYVLLTCEDPHAPRPSAGQFYMLTAARRWGGGEAERPFLPRACSVFKATAGTDELQFLLEDVGPGTRRLCELAPGDELLLLGPLGKPFAPPREGRGPLLIGGGVGIAPLAILQDQLAPDSAALLGFRDAARAPARKLLRNVTVATDDGSAGRQGLVTDLAREALEVDQGVEVYACGPPGLLETVRVMCTEHDVPAQLALESGMACGFGACFGCVVPTRKGYLRLCVDGPVLDAALLESAALAGAHG
jgi:NAD(P)H-flavin reductase